MGMSHIGLHSVRGEERLFLNAIAGPQVLFIPNRSLRPLLAALVTPKSSGDSSTSIPSIVLSSVGAHTHPQQHDGDK